MPEKMGRPKHFEHSVRVQFWTEYTALQELMSIAEEAEPPVTISRLIDGIVQDYLKGRDKCTG